MNTASASTRLTNTPVASPSSASRARPRQPFGGRRGAGVRTEVVIEVARGIRVVRGRPQRGGRAPMRPRIPEPPSSSLLAAVVFAACGAPPDRRPHDRHFARSTGRGAAANRAIRRAILENRWKGGRGAGGGSRESGVGSRCCDRRDAGSVVSEHAGPKGTMQAGSRAMPPPAHRLPTPDFRPSTPAIRGCSTKHEYTRCRCPRADSRLRTSDSRDTRVLDASRSTRHAAARAHRLPPPDFRPPRYAIVAAS